MQQDLMTPYIETVRAQINALAAPDKTLYLNHADARIDVDLLNKGLDEIQSAILLDDLSPCQRIVANVLAALMPNKRG